MSSSQTSPCLCVLLAQRPGLKPCTPSTPAIPLGCWNISQPSPLSPQIDTEKQALCPVIFSLKHCCEKPNGYHYSSCDSSLLFLKVKEGWAPGEEAVKGSGKKLFRAKGFPNFSSLFHKETGLRDQIK